MGVFSVLFGQCLVRAAWTKSNLWSFFMYQKKKKIIKELQILFNTFYSALAKLNNFSLSLKDANFLPLY